MPIENVLAMAKQKAKEAYDEDWLQKAQEIARGAAPSASVGQSFEKLDALPMKQFGLSGSEEDPAIIVVKAMNDLHLVPKLNKSVFDAEVLMSSSNAVEKGKYSIWGDYAVFNDEIENYRKEFADGNLTDQTFMICGYGKQKKKSNPAQSVYLFRVLPPP